MWTALCRHFRERCASLKGDYRVFVTGDLSARGEVKSLELVRMLLCGDPSSGISEESGLRIPPEKLLTVPGNHDVWDGHLLRPNSLQNFCSVFHPDSPYPSTRVDEIDGVRFIFVGLESTHLKISWNPACKLGRGLVKSPQLDLAAEFLQSTKADVRIAFLHHSPITPPGMERDWTLILENPEELIEWSLTNAVDALLFGHIHADYSGVSTLKSILKLLPDPRGAESQFLRFESHPAGGPPANLIHIRGRRVSRFDSFAYHRIS